MAEESGWAKSLRSFTVGAKRAAERTTHTVLQKVGLKNGHVDDPEFDFMCKAYSQQTGALKSLRSDVIAVRDAFGRVSGVCHSLAVGLQDALPANMSETVRATSETLVQGQTVIADNALRRTERRILKRVLGPIEDELLRARDVAQRLDQRKRTALDYERYRSRAEGGLGSFGAGNPSWSAGGAGNSDAVKAEEKMQELQACSRGLIDTMESALPRRAALIEACMSEAIEFQRRFYLEAGKAMDRVVESIGSEQLAAMRLNDDEPGTTPPPRASSPSPSPPSSQSVPAKSSAAPPKPNVDDDLFSFAQPVDTSKQFSESRREYTSIWDDDDDDSSTDFVFGAEPSAGESFGSEPEERNHASGGDDYRHDARSTSKQGTYPDSYPSGGVGQRENIRQSSGPDARPPRKANSFPPSSFVPETSPPPEPTRLSRSRNSMSSFEETAPSRPTRKPRNKSRRTPASSGDEASLKTNGRTNASAASGDLLGSFDSPPRKPKSSKPRKSKTTTSTSTTKGEGSLDDLMSFGGAASSVAKSGSSTAEADLLGAFDNVRSTSTSSAAPPPQKEWKSSSSNSSEAAKRAEYKRKERAEIEKRAKEKLAAMRANESKAESERAKKDQARNDAESRIMKWTAGGARRGNLRALLASLDTVLYPGASWTSVTMTELSGAKVKRCYHKAILLVHPDKISSRELSALDRVTAELVFDELQNGHAVWTAEQEGRAPPPGSVGPKGGSNTGGMNMGGMNNMAGMGRAYGSMGQGYRGRGGMGGVGGFGAGMGMGGRGYGNMGGMGGFGSGMGMGMGMGMGQGSGFGRGYGSYGNMANGRGYGMNNQAPRR